MALGLFYRTYSAQFGNIAPETSYLDIHDATECSSLVEDPPSIFRADQTPSEDNGFGIVRSALYFDTSTLPDSIVISAVRLRLSIRTSTTHIGVIQNGMPDYPHNPAVVGDYYYDNYSTDNQIEFGPYTSDGNKYVDFPEDNFDWINTTGYTKLMFRVKTDVDAEEPTGYEIGLRAWNDYRMPYITVTYEEAAAYDYPIYPVIFPLR